MSSDLRNSLLPILSARHAIIGVGNVDLTDDGAGIRLAEQLHLAGWPRVFIGGNTPEATLFHLGEDRNRPEHVLFLDAADFGGAAGDVVLLDGNEMQHRFPQVSTHTLSLGMIARIIVQQYGIKVWMLGIQVGSIHFGSTTTPAVGRTVEVLFELLNEMLTTQSGQYEKCPDSVMAGECMV